MGNVMLPPRSGGGGVQIAVGSYVGTGTYGSGKPNSLTFDFEPKMVVIFEDGNGLKPYDEGRAWTKSFIWCEGQRTTRTYAAESIEIFTYRESNTFLWYSTYSNSSQLNQSGTTYNYLAIG